MDKLGVEFSSYNNSDTLKEEDAILKKADKNSKQKPPAFLNKEINDKYILNTDTSTKESAS